MFVTLAQHAAEFALMELLGTSTLRIVVSQETRAAEYRRQSLPYSHISHMVIHMKTTLNIDATIMAKLKREAARQGRTMSEMVETALRLMFSGARKRAALPELPSFRGGRELVDIADRDALYRALEEP